MLGNLFIFIFINMDNCEDSNCTICKKNIGKNSKYLKCDICDNFLYSKCGGFTEESLAHL